MERASIHSSGARRIPCSLLSSIFAIVVLPEPGKPHTIINLEPPPDFSMEKIIAEDRNPGHSTLPRENDGRVWLGFPASGRAAEQIPQPYSRSPPQNAQNKNRAYWGPRPRKRTRARGPHYARLLFCACWGGED